ncbi:tRNA uridine-5-carboxymethylaminomethyl(34) synthesis GTPase MnmE [bacterium]|nr:tRNA uridine-5-carboxymethylaminomethyl(34) synthesis GTPase MnmE [bacterium]
MTNTETMATTGQDTIAAIATPPGTSGIAVIRISGDGAVDLAARVFDGSDPRSAASHTVHHGMIRDADGEALDEVLLTVFRAPHSYTGEDSVEISCHGGSVVSRGVLTLLLGAGARAAEPGEFTRRAFLNGKMDLSQAEAVADLIHARSTEAHRASLRQLEGRLSGYVTDIREQLLHAAGMLELSLDFVEEDVEFLSSGQLGDMLTQAEARLQTALDSFSGGRVIREGARVVLLGAPNVGKSSLLNALLGTRRAIVTEMPGTTRDYLEEGLLLHGEYLRLIDTAGMRETEDLIEREGIAFSMEAVRNAEIVCLLSDARDGAVQAIALQASLLQEQLLREDAATPVLLLFNKSDLVDADAAEELAAHGLPISALHGDGVDALGKHLAAVARELRSESEEGEVLVTNARHADCLRRGLEAIRTAATAQREGMTEEILAADVRRAIDALGEIIGEVTTDDILNGVFSRFCIGK